MSSPFTFSLSLIFIFGCQKQRKSSSIIVQNNLSTSSYLRKDQAATKPKHTISTVTRISSVHNPGPRSSFDISTPVDARPVQSNFRSYADTAPPPPPAKKPSCRGEFFLHNFKLLLLIAVVYFKTLLPG